MELRITQLKTYLAAGSILLALTACSDDPEAPIEKPVTENASRTVLVYQAANNNLGTPSAAYDVADVKEMIKAAKAGDIGDGRLLVYRGAYRTAPLLLEITKEKLDTIKYYSDDTLSVDSRRLSQVLKDMTTIAPANEYGLVLWSHGSGWLQDGMEAPTVANRSFGSESGKTMNITTLKEVLEAGPKLQWLYFDCCFMASIETVYELRHTAPVIVASPTELPVNGMPYDLNIKEFFRSGTADMVQAATNTFNSYDNLVGAYRTCTMSVINTGALDALADATAAIYKQAQSALPDGFEGQRYEEASQLKCRYFDFRHYVNALCFDDNGTQRFENAKELMTNFDAALKDCIKYEDSTPMLWASIPLTYHSGLSTYILRNSDSITYRNYNTLSWYDKVAYNLIVK